MGRQFDYIFSDPPYENGFIQETIEYTTAMYLDDYRGPDLYGGPRSIFSAK